MENERREREEGLASSSACGTSKDLKDKPSKERGKIFLGRQDGIRNAFCRRMHPHLYMNTHTSCTYLHTNAERWKSTPCDRNEMNKARVTDPCGEAPDRLC